MLLQLIIYAIHKYFRIPVSPRAAAGRVGTIINPKKSNSEKQKKTLRVGKIFFTL